MLAAVDWHVIWSRIFHPDHAFALALTRTIYISVAAQLFGVVFGLIAALMRASRVLAAPRSSPGSTRSSSAGPR